MSEETPIERRLRESLPEGVAPDTLWEHIAAERAGRTARRPRRRWLVPALATGAVAAATLGVMLLLHPTPRPSAWTYRGKQLKVGDTITASAGTVYLLREPSIGRLALMPGTRLRITDSSKQKRLKLEQGKVSALVTAPPRLFAVETGSGIATDLGCAYDLQTSSVRVPGFPGLLGARRSITQLTVKTGWVELADRKGGVVQVPAGASCRMDPDNVGLPSFDDSPEVLRILQPNIQGEWPELADALKAATRPKDTLTLFYLLSRVTEVESPQIWDRLLQLVPPPKGISKTDLLAQDAKAMSAYEAHLKEIWNPVSDEFWNLLINDITKGKKK